MTVWSEIQPLKSVVLGNVFKTDDLLSCLNLSEKWAAPFREINQKAEQELDSIAELLNDFRIIVYRPKIYNIKSDIGLVSPPLSPRDWLLSYGDEVLVGNEASLNHHVRTHSTDHLIKDPLRMPHHDRWSDIAFNNLNDASLARPYLHMANVIRCGMDVFLTQHPDTSGNKLL